MAEEKPQKQWLRFGIPSLDRLFSPRGQGWEAGIRLRPPIPGNEEDGNAPDQYISLCIQGPSGTGKSVLGLHLASRYWADSLKWVMGPNCDGKNSQALPRILYVSTDLGFKRAESTWDSFGLGYPNKREIPYKNASLIGFDSLIDRVVKLKHHGPNNLVDLAKYVKGDDSIPKDGVVAFLDLAENTAGDDWGFITRLVSLLRPPGDKDPHHLLVIDAVEGLEMLTAETDAYGQLRSRRSRIAQILRAAAKKCHVVLVLEEDSAHQHPAEEYVTDIVMRLRVRMEETYCRRTIELVKARGQTHIRGEHDYVIRSSRKKTDAAEKAAAPPDAEKVVAPPVVEKAVVLPVVEKVVAPPGAQKTVAPPDDPVTTQSYVHIMRSLHSLSRVLMYDDEFAPLAPAADNTLALIETPKLGSILPTAPMGDKQDNDPKFPHFYTFSGLHRGKVTSLIGDEATLKSRFGRAFLAGAFAHRFVENKPEAAVLITTFNFPREDIKRKLVQHLGGLNDTTSIDFANKTMDELMIYRQLEVHYLNSNHLFHIIRRCVERALDDLERVELKLGKNAVTKEQGRHWAARSERASRVRVVIDDWSLIQSAHPEIYADRLFLPFLIKYFQRVGVTALIIATQPGRPEEILSGTSEQPLRALSDFHLYTWHVPFYGTDRVAITAIPPMAQELPPSVGELRNPTVEEINPPAGRVKPTEETLNKLEAAAKEACQERLWHDDHFELYSGVEKKDPQPVPLEIHLFSGAAGFEEYTAKMGGLLQRLFTSQPGGQVLIPENHAQYAELRDFYSLHGGVRSNHSIVIQVDEYWKETGLTRDERAIKYLRQKTYDKSNQKPSAVHDPYSLFQPIPRDGEERKQFCKHDFFDPIGYGNEWWKHVTGVPYQWDFGFMLLKKRAWEEACKQELADVESRKNDKVEIEITDAQSSPINDVYHALTGLKKKDVTWRAFFDACLRVSLFNSRPGTEPLSPFDLDTCGPQSFACLVLEVWASEIKMINGEYFKVAFPETRHPEADSNSPGKQQEPDQGLHDLLINPDCRLALFRTWMLLAEVLDPKSLTNNVIRLAARPAAHASVAERHWYSTGSLIWKKVSGDDPLVPVRLPGCGAVRGDWFLMVGKESRSQRLGERAMDLLCRRRSNQERMELGLGLPVRKLNARAWDENPILTDVYAGLLTGMMTFNADGRRRFVRYSDCLGIGAYKQTDFQWLWRSRLKNYHHHDRVWEKWLGLILVEAERHARRLRNDFHLAPFRAYDYLKDKKNDLKSPGRMTQLVKTDGKDPHTDEGKLCKAINSAWDKFNTRCESLVSELHQ